jgi:hypothetical protein
MPRGEITGKGPAQTGAPKTKRRASPDAELVRKPDELAEPIADSTIEPATAKSEPKTPAKPKTSRVRGPPVPAAWYSLKEFAAAHRLSEAKLFELKAKGLGPRETEVGSRKFVTFEDAAAWRAAQQKATTAA